MAPLVVRLQRRRRSVTRPAVMPLLDPPLPEEPLLLPLIAPPLPERPTLHPLIAVPVHVPEDER
jgi:hypothetical protein